MYPRQSAYLQVAGALSRQRGSQRGTAGDRAQEEQEATAAEDYSYTAS